MSYDEIEFCSAAPGQEEILGCDVELVRDEMPAENGIVLEVWGWRSIFERYQVTHGRFASQDEARADALRHGPGLWPA